MNFLLDLPPQLPVIPAQAGTQRACKTCGSPIKSGMTWERRREQSFKPGFVFWVHNTL